jgi:hypothetical protein
MFPAMFSRMRCPLLLMMCACCVACMHDDLVIVMKQKQLLTIALHAWKGCEGYSAGVLY